MCFLPAHSQCAPSALSVQEATGAVASTGRVTTCANSGVVLLSYSISSNTSSPVSLALSSSPDSVTCTALNTPVSGNNKSGPEMQTPSSLTRWSRACSPASRQTLLVVTTCCRLALPPASLCYLNLPRPYTHPHTHRLGARRHSQH